MPSILSNLPVLNSRQNQYITTYLVLKSRAVDMISWQIWDFRCPLPIPLATVVVNDIIDSGRRVRRAAESEIDILSTIDASEN